MFVHRFAIQVSTFAFWNTPIHAYSDVISCQKLCQGQMTRQVILVLLIGGGHNCDLYPYNGASKPTTAKRKL